MEGGEEEADEDMLRKTDLQDLGSPLKRKSTPTQQANEGQCICRIHMSHSLGFSLEVNQEQCRSTYTCAK